MSEATPDRKDEFWSRRTVQNGDVTLAVFEAGDPSRPTLVMVHGWPDTHRLWTGVARLLAAEFRLVAYDTRGFGESSEPDADSAYELPQLAQDFRAVVDAVSPDPTEHELRIVGLVQFCAREHQAGVEPRELLLDALQYLHEPGIVARVDDDADRATAAHAEIACGP